MPSSSFTVWPIYTSSSSSSWWLSYSCLCFLRLWGSQNIRTQRQTCRTSVTLKKPGHLASRTEFGGTLGHNPLKLGTPGRLGSLGVKSQLNCGSAADLRRILPFWLLPVLPQPSALDIWCGCTPTCRLASWCNRSVKADIRLLHNSLGVRQEMHAKRV
jgi:hypothetical protein